MIHYQRFCPEAAQAKALQAQIKQLVQMNAQRKDGELGYNFTDGKIIKNLLVEIQQRSVK